MPYQTHRLLQHREPLETQRRTPRETRRQKDHLILPTNTYLPYLSQQTDPCPPLVRPLPRTHDWPSATPKSRVSPRHPCPRKTPRTRPASPFLAPAAQYVLHTHTHTHTHKPF
ncbi:hypothetical protein LZ30DRAFT_707722 [Colletotrichum cereale]|nr:hypothetical protein LZ30DRAFT_707722 [Colletotrichum cereale]